MSSSRKYPAVAEFIDKHSKQPNVVRGAVAKLFPILGDTLGEPISHRRDVRPELAAFRIANKNFVSSYFHLTPHGPIWRREELPESFGSKSPHVVLENAEKRIGMAPLTDQPQLRRTLLEHLKNTFRTRRTPFTQNWLDSLVKFSASYIGAYDDLAGTFFSWSFMDYLESVVIAGLDSLETSSRTAIFSSAVDHTNEITLLCSTFRTVAPDLNNEGSTNQERDPYFGDATDDVREKLVFKTREIANSDLMWDQADPQYIIWFWWGADHGAEVRNFTAREMRHLTGLRGLMELSISLIRSTSGNYEVVKLAADKIVDTELLKKHAEQLLHETGSAEDKALAGRFLAAHARRQLERD